MPPARFRSLDEVSDYLNKLYVKLSESQTEGFAGNITTSTADPSVEDGVDGDVWVSTPD